MSEFKKYLHLEKYGNTAVEGINLGTVHVFPKLDGTNASVWLNEDGAICYGSRNRQLSLDNDNAGFMNEMASTSKGNEVKSFLASYPEMRLFGEWLVKHTIKNYKEDAWRNFYVFDVYDTIEERYLSYDEYSPLLYNFAVDYIQCQKVIVNGEFEDFVHQANLSDYLMPEGEAGEGVVLKNYEFINRYGRYEAAKVVRTDFKAKHRKEMGAPVQENRMDEDAIAQYFTKEMAEKVFAKIVNQRGEWSSRFIPQLLETCYYDFFNEELYDAVKKSRAKKCEFNALRHFIMNRTKEFLPQVF